MIPLILLWVLAGWSGVPVDFKVPPWQREPDPKLPPRPRPYWLTRIIGMVAGVIGGFAFLAVFGPQPEPWRVVAGPHPEPWATAVFAAATAAGAFIAARIVTDIYEQLSTRRG